MDEPPRPDAFRILTWIGIIEQLTRSAADRNLKAVDLSYPEFTLLTHFSHGHPPEKTVTGIAAAMQQLQPAVTKTVQKLLAKGLLKASPSALDGRSKVLTMTAKGTQALGRALMQLAPALCGVLDGWSDAELREFFRLLDRLKTHMDASRG